MVPFLLPLVDVPAPDARALAEPPAEVRPAETAPPPAEARPKRHDPFFPGGGHANLSLSSGLPFLAMGEVAFGLGDRFAIGAVGAATQGPAGFGVNPRVALFDTGRFRGVVMAPSLYYPFAPEGGSPWVLTRPRFVLEHAWAFGLRVGGGLGAVATTSTDRRPAGYGEKNVATGIWNSFDATVAMPLGERTSLFAEGTLVMNGLRVADDSVVPYAFAAGVATKLF